MRAPLRLSGSSVDGEKVDQLFAILFSLFFLVILILDLRAGKLFRDDEGGLMPALQSLKKDLVLVQTPKSVKPDQVPQIHAEAILNRLEDKASFTEAEKDDLKSLLTHSNIEIEERAFDLLSHDPTEMSFLLEHTKLKESEFMHLIDEQQQDVNKISSYERFFKTRNLRLLARYNQPSETRISPIVSVWNVDLGIARRMLEQILTEPGAPMLPNMDSIIQPGRRDLLPKLSHIISDESKELTVRVSAVNALAEVDPRVCWDYLIKALESEIPVIRYSAAEALGKLGKMEAIPHLLKVAAGPNPFVKSIALDSLARLGAREAIPLMIESLEIPNEEVAFSARQALIRLRCREDVCQALFQTVAQVDKSRKALYFELLATLGERRIIPQLEELLDSTESELALAAANGLLILRETKHLDKILRISKELGAEKNTVVQEISGLVPGSDFIQFLNKQITHCEDADMQFFALQIILQELEKDPRSFSVENLRPALVTENSFIRGLAILALSKIPHPDIEKEIKHGLKDTSDYVRACAVAACYDLEKAAVLPRFELMLATDPADDVLFAVLNCLNREHTLEAAQIIQRCLANLPENLRVFGTQIIERISTASRKAALKL